MTETATDTILHASTVAFGPRAVLLLGPSGAGKSTLALELLSRGARLIADDRTRVTRLPDGLQVAPPAAIAGRIEARGIGLLACPYDGPAWLHLVVDLAVDSASRLPPHAMITILGTEIELLNGRGLPNLAAALPLLMTGARVD